MAQHRYVLKRGFILPGVVMLAGALVLQAGCAQQTTSSTTPVPTDTSPKTPPPQQPLALQAKTFDEAMSVSKAKLENATPEERDAMLDQLAKRFGVTSRLAPPKMDDKTRRMVELVKQRGDSMGKELTRLSPQERAQRLARAVADARREVFGPPVGLSPGEVEFQKMLTDARKTPEPTTADEKKLAAAREKLLGQEKPKVDEKRVVETAKRQKAYLEAAAALAQPKKSGEPADPKVIQQLEELKAKIFAETEK